MIVYLSHTRIDKNRWDDCISRSANRRVYAFSWYLDLVCPGWEALVEDDYVRVFPLTQHRKWGIRYLAQPFFAQQLGVFSPEPLTEGQVLEFIRAVPEKFKFIEIQLNAMNKVAGDGLEITRRVNYELDLSPGYDELAGRYAQNTRRNIRKADGSAVTTDRHCEVESLVELFRLNFGRKEGKLKEHDYKTIRQLIVHCLAGNLGYILASRSKEGVLSAAAFFLFDQSHVYFLFAASAPRARENGAMFLLIDRFIRDNSGTSLVLDFEGGNDPDLGRFYKGFGASEVHYPALRVNRLSKVADTGLYFARKLRK